MDAAVTRTEQVATDLKEATRTGVEQFQAVLRESAEDARVATHRANESIARDSDDAATTASVNAGLLNDPDLSAIRFDVDTRDGVVRRMVPRPAHRQRNVRTPSYLQSKALHALTII